MKKALAISLGFGSFLAAAVPAFAQSSVNPCPTATQFTKLCNLTANNVGPIVGAVIQLILVIAIVIALFFLILGGIRWITSGGDKAKVESARNTIIAAIIGIVIALLSFFLLQLALGFFGLSLTNLTLPSIPGIR